MAEYFEKEALIREIISDMASFVGDPDAVQKHDEQCNYAISCIESAPVSDVAPVVHGRWEAKGYVCGESEFECSACHKTEWRTTISQFKFCPFCGARMDGDAE